MHYATDLLTGVGVLTALLITHYVHWPNIDAYFAIVIAVYILHSAWKIGFDAVQALIDHELPEAERDLIKKLAMTHVAVLGVHDLRTRQSGPTKFIQLHLDLDGRLTLEDAHIIAEDVEAAIQKSFPQSDIIIHQDPIVCTAP